MNTKINLYEFFIGILQTLDLNLIRGLGPELFEDLDLYEVLPQSYNDLEDCFDDLGVEEHLEAML